MGCYGIGVSRIIAAAIEQNHDDKGIIWPDNISPFHAVIIEIDGHKNEKVRKLSNKVYSELVEKGIDILLDDRNSKLGSKLHDWELIGITKFLIIGKAEADSESITFKKRGDSKKNLISLNSIDKIFEN